MILKWPLILFTLFSFLAGGTFTMQGVLTTLGKGRKTQLPALVCSMAAAVAAAVALVMHVKHWDRLFGAFSNITSSLSLSMIGLIAVVVIGLVSLLMMNRSEEGIAPKWCGVLAIIAGVFLPIVVGDGYLVTARNVVDNPMLIVYSVGNALALGSLMACVLSGICKEDDGRELVVIVALASLVIQAIAVIGYAATVTTTSGNLASSQYLFDPASPANKVTASAAAIDLMGGSNAAPFWGVVVALGCIVPLVTTFLGLKAKGAKLAVLAVVGLACVIAAAIVWRGMLGAIAISAVGLM